jgi:glutaredoxin
MRQVLLLILMFCIQCKEGKNTDFSGEWNYENFDNENSLENKTFSLHLNQNKDSITGYYCSLSRNGNRIDCFDEKDENLKGKVDNDTLYIDFTSSFNDKTGKAKLYFKGKKLYWSITKSEGEIYLPSNILLEK